MKIFFSLSLFLVLRDEGLGFFIPTIPVYTAPKGEDLTVKSANLTDPGFTLRPAHMPLSYDMTTKLQRAVTTSDSSSPPSSEPSDLFWLLLIPIVLVMASALLLLICQNGSSRGSKTETELYENSGPAAVSEPAYLPEPPSGHDGP